MQEKANTFDKVGLFRHEVDKAFVALKKFRQKFPFTENLREIETLDPNKLFKINPDFTGEFFQTLDEIFKPLKYPTVDNTNIYRNARLQINDFKILLRTAVDNRKTLAQKIDAKWEKIGGINEDKNIAMKIIYSFNYENKTALPIFNIQHLRHFTNRTSDTLNEPTKYLSIGQEYEHYTAELLKNKNNQPATRGWDNLYFTRFLYETYTPPDNEKQTTTTFNEEKKIVNQVTDEQLDMQGFVKLLCELQKQHKITGEEFRENRATWTQLKPNDREVLVIRLKQRLNNETPIDNKPKSQPIIKRKL
ncbi:MAG: hypothetical protein LBH62_06875 [Nitrososphaerota archaeon]|uniref:hypothetical protein n=1 Tax=Candidatus Bathycorpusculum sp. TaxID=2994959 RepID=UPI0028396D3A|nr:hypothetical protein [Candidatus Termiticorpusculum sp.]MDR0461135.1 hypothetical protein [Nitrososphaerota archaeon]